jgi:hypothetical protein
MSFGRGASGGGWLVANVCVRASPITIGMQIGTSRPAVALAERLGFLEELRCALLIDLRYRRRRERCQQVQESCRMKRSCPHRAPFSRDARL